MLELEEPAATAADEEAAAAADDADAEAARPAADQSLQGAGEVEKLLVSERFLARRRANASD